MRFIITSLIICSSIFGKNKVITSISSENILIGEPIVLTINASLDTLYFARFPELDFIGSNINIENIQLSENKVSYTIKLWDLGQIIVSSIPIEIIHNNKIVDIIYTEEISIFVKSILTKNTENIKTIKGLRSIEIPNTISLIIYLIIIISTILIIIYLFKNKITTQVNVDKINIYKNSPYIIAINELNNIDYPTPITTNTIEKYYLKLSYILRRYLGSEFYFKATEMTTDEVYNYIEHQDIIVTGIKKKIKSLLIKSDSAKYALYIPVIEDLNNDAKYCNEIISELHQNINK